MHLLVGLEIICPAFIQIVGVENRNLKKGIQRSDIQKAYNENSFTSTSDFFLIKQRNVSFCLF